MRHKELSNQNPVNPDPSATHRDRVWQAALAALLHDVGKFAQRAEADPERYRSLANLHLFAVTEKATDEATGNTYTRTAYHHAAYTWQFIETHLPWLTSVGDGGDQNVAGWAARHHKPSSAFDHLVAEADGLSAGMDRGHPDESIRGWSHVQQARLVPLLAEVGCDEEVSGWEVPLRRLSFDRTIFPQEARSRSQAEAVREYAALFAEFAAEASRVHGGDIRRFLTSFLAVYERFAWCVPAATNCTPRDVSLFEHSRAASAIAAASAAQLLATGEVTVERVRDRADPRYLLVVGDLFGIQRFLYTIVSKHAARALRGRSFFLQILSDAIASRLLAELDLPPTNALFVGGGKLWLLLPAAAEERVASLAEEIDLGLQKTYGGRLGFAIGLARIAGKDFVEKRMAAAFRDATADLHVRRHRRLSRLGRERYDEVFAPLGDPQNEDVCRVCGQLDADLADLPDESRRACRECRDLEDLGRLLPYARSALRVRDPERAERLASRLRSSERRPLVLTMPPVLGASYVVTEQDAATCSATAEPDDVVFALNETTFIPEGNAPVVMLFAGSVGHWEKGTFEDLAAQSTGVERLGVLRMDVDSMGEKLARGFVRRRDDGSEEDLTTISRLTNLSKSLAYFFGGYVAHLLAEPDRPWSGKAQLIYSGGDDLFVVGAWSALPGFAREIRRELDAFVAHNPEWGVSGGLAVVSANHPIASGAAMAGELEHLAKSHRRSSGKSKDALALAGESIGWRDLDVVGAMVAEILALIAADERELPGFGVAEDAPSALARSFVHRLARIAHEHREACKSLRASGPKRSLAEIEQGTRRGRWAWTAAYEIARLARSGPLRERLDAFRRALPGRTWPGSDEACEADVIHLLQPAARLAELLTRERS
ncbi:MAG TPA: type III-A CRISPR-associated protein Cas10/Csm1 [Candidatus Binatia bacterium]